MICVKDLRMNWVDASAPSNIALIKYMGKTDSKVNRPANSSLSFTLDKLRTFVRIRLNTELQNDSWKNYERTDLLPISLSDKGQQKFLAHFQMLKQEFKIKGFFEIESANNFPSDCGLASSASSFAALTQVAHDWAVAQSAGAFAPYRPKELARLSQRGSGSSCRSFFSPWSLWHADGAEAIGLPYQNLKHQVILCDTQIKSVSSSEAHRLVTTSDLFKGRPERAEERLKQLIQSMRVQDWKKSFEICWNEFWDMHLLFHTSQPAFIYMNDISLKVLREILAYWQNHQDGPLVTMDAGSNIHLMYRVDQTEIYQQFSQKWRSQVSLWTDEGYLEKI